MSVISKKILSWYSVHGRDLPWRDTKDPYVIWISEIILQQTKVAQGYDYFRRFISRFPTLQDLADAEEEEVLTYWQGLGYYSRARNLHAAARSMNGIFPSTYAEVKALKGVGDYTAAAICSFAYGMPFAVVDGNVYRVLARYFNVDTPIDTTQGKKRFKALADEMLDVNAPDDYNQAIMDFGAQQCVPKNPDCASCPLVEGCAAFRLGVVSQLPVKQKKTKVRNRFFNYFFIRQGDYLFLHKRQEEDIWKNLYQFPLIETSEELSMDQLQTETGYLQLFTSLEHDYLLVPHSSLKHVLSHQILHLNFYEVEVKEGFLLSAPYQRVHIDEIAAYPVPRPIDIFLEKLV